VQSQTDDHHPRPFPGRPEKMKLVRLFQNVWKRMRDRILLIDFKIKQRRHLKKQKADDPNIYPLF
jgi:hypothetical protein